MSQRAIRLYALLGPGILFAASAIGVSHLVQSTRAGAMYGLAMIPILLVACAAKYPSLLFGLLYPAHTGRTLLHSYREAGVPIFIAYLGLVIFAMWFTLAAIAVTTAGLWQALVGPPASISAATAVMLALAGAVLLSGRYSGLEHISKILLGLLAILLPIATLLVLPKLDFTQATLWQVNWDIPTIAFIIALTGWMPIPVDASVTSSTWAASRNAQTNQVTAPHEAKLDFNVGYAAAAVFAVCFLLLGAGVLHTANVAPPDGAGAFASMVIELFTAQLGSWSFYLIGTIAFVTMFTTLLTVLDGQVRVLQFAAALFKPEVLQAKRIYPVGIVLYGLGGLSVVMFFMQSFTTFISFVTSLGFLLAPAVVVLNHRAMFGGEIPNAQQPPRYLYWWSLVGGLALCSASAVYFYLLVS